MADTSQSLSHSRGKCQAHVVFVPQRRRQALVGPSRKAWGPSLHALARQKACRILEGHVKPEHGPIGIERPPKSAVASGIGCLKGHSASPIARPLSGRERTCTGEPCWARGSAVSTVGFALEQGRASIREPEPADDQGRL